MLSQANLQIKPDPDNVEKAIDIDPKTYCKLGHFNLLLEAYPKGKSCDAFFWHFFSWIME